MIPSDLGIPFPLFDADIQDASEYVGKEKCTLCGKTEHAFELDIGCALMATCPSCGTENGLDASNRDSSSCRSCGHQILFPEIEDSSPIHICYPCLRSGKGAITSDTVLGMVSWEQAQEGLTHGVPGEIITEFELVEDEEGWHRARVEKAHLYELLRTPNYSTIQGEQWQFCCKAPMVFVGRWDQARFEREAAGIPGKQLFAETVKGIVEGLWEDELHDITGVYVFRCQTCNKLTAHWDIA
jgi:uncharacterized protein CbrC (UPF0167 family)